MPAMLPSVYHDGRNDGSVSKQRAPGLPNCFSLLEESRESWHEFVADKFVYIDKLLHRKHQFLPFIPKSELHQGLWLELHILLKDNAEREHHYTAIVEPQLSDRISGSRNLGKLKLHHSRMERKVPMLVNVPQVIELPKIGTFVSIPSVVRLKRLNDVDRALWHPLGRTLNETSELSVGLWPVANRKTYFMFRQLIVFDRESKGQMIQRGTQASDEIASNQGQGVERNVNHRNSNEVLSGLNILFSADAITLRLLKSRDFSIQQVKVFLRPLNLQIWAI